jgi:hypothetical protein
MTRGNLRALEEYVAVQQVAVDDVALVRQALDTQVRPGPDLRCRGPAAYSPNSTVAASISYTDRPGRAGR